MKSKPKNFIVTYEDGTPEKMLYSYKIALSLCEATGGHLLIIIS